MSPDYLYELADKADPNKLWRLGALEQLALLGHLRQQLDAGVALRRYAEHVRELHALLGTGKSMLLTPLSRNGTERRTIPTPPGVIR